MAMMMMMMMDDDDGGAKTPAPFVHLSWCFLLVEAVA